MTRSLSMYLKQTVLCAAVSLGSATASAAVVFSDNFDANNFNTIWSVSDGGVDVGAYSLCNNGTAGLCVDTEGTGENTNATFSLATPIGLAAGNYNFSFDWGNNDGLDHPNGGGVNILDWKISSGLTVLASGSVNSGGAPDFTYANSSTSFFLGSSVTDAVISFSQTGSEGDWGGTVLDNVVLDQTSQVPEPATMLLLGLGLLGLGASRVKR